MQQQYTSIPLSNVGLRYGIILGVITIVIFLISILFEGQVVIGGSLFHFPFYAVIVYRAHRYFKQYTGGYMRFGQGMRIASWTGLVGNLMSSFFTYVYVKFIDTPFLDTLRDKQVAEIAGSNLPKADIEELVKILNELLRPEPLFFTTVIGGWISVVIVALVVTKFTKTKPAPAH